MCQAVQGDQYPGTGVTGRNLPPRYWGVNSGLLCEATLDQQLSHYPIPQICVPSSNPSSSVSYLCDLRNTKQDSCVSMTSLYIQFILKCEYSHRSA